jgi:hypothetical protein
MNPTPYGFRVVGHRAGTRRPIDRAAAFVGYAECDPRAEIHREAFLSLFAFDRTFVEYLKRNRSEAGYSGPCGADWLWWDVDRPNDLPAALNDTRRLSAAILEAHRELDEDDLLIFLSGGKGFHVGLPAAWGPEPTPSFHAVAKLYCQDLAERAGIVVDAVIYTRTRLFRAPNSRHPKTGLFKRRLSFGELIYSAPEAIVKKAAEPEPFEIPTGPATFPSGADAWRRCVAAVEGRSGNRPAPCDGSKLLDRAIDGSKLQALTLDFIRDGAPEGEREVRLFRAAANLAEFDCPPGLAHALLTEAALDSGLTPSETRRAIDSGLARVRRRGEGGAS